MIDFIIEILLKPFFNEKLRVLKYYDQKHTAIRLLANSDSRYQKKGLSLLFELATSYPYRVQEIINEITAFLRNNFPQEKLFDSKKKEVLKLCLRSLTAIPRTDTNGFPYDFDLHQIRIEDINIPRTNFQFFLLWGCQFRNVILSHSSFKDADLGGVIFENCSLEYADFKGAKICDSFMDEGRPARLMNTRLWGTNLKEAEIELCELHNFDKIDLSSLQPKILEGKLRIIQGCV